MVVSLRSRRLNLPNICWLGANICAAGAMLTDGHPAMDTGFPETGLHVVTVANDTGTVATLAATVLITCI